MNLFKKWQPTIYKNLNYIISNEKTSTNWNHRILDELLEFSIGGKCIRGGLFLSLFEIFDYPFKDIHFQASASIELTHSSLLIHDDIMDRDTKRRNKPTMHCRFQPKEFGNAVAICAGDIGFWISCKYVAQLGSKEYNFFIQEMINVACGQIQDVFLGYTQKSSLDTIIQMYVDKTSRYTFALPMILFCICTNQKQEKINMYNNLAHQLGILYQIIDDELGVLGNENILGKSIVSDFTGLQKNIYWFYLKKSNFSFPKHLKKENFDIQEIRNFIIQNGIQKNIKKYTEKILKKINSIINQFTVEKEKKFFTELVHYIKDRNK